MRKLAYNGYNMASGKKEEFATYVRNFMFGVEDSLVSTVGLLSGVAAAGLSKNEVFLTGIVLIFVEAFSMAVGSYLSEESEEEYMKDKKSLSLHVGLIMFFSYFAAGFIPLAPYLVFSVTAAFVISIFLSLLALFTLGLVSSRVLKDKHTYKHAIRMLIIGGLAIGVGIMVGKLVNV
jgi:VIT1/CCC1 family predicted Fe2+/Mn2+ transporter